MSKILLPERLYPGDTVGVVAPASPPGDPAVIDRAVATFEELGLTVVLGKAVRRRHGYLAGADSERASDIMRFFRDRKIRGIFALRGGYGASRTLPLLDYSTIGKNPKIFSGFSDITALLLGIYAKTGLITFHGPMVASDFGREIIQSFTVESLKRTVMSSSAPGSILSGRGAEYRELTTIRSGKARGRLVGGNLSVLCSLVGTPYIPSLRGAILFIEDINEPPYRIDRYLTQLHQSGTLNGIKGILLGSWTDCIDKLKGRRREYRQVTLDVLSERFATLKVPILAGVPFGHIDRHLMIPIGGTALLNGSGRSLDVLRCTRGR